MLQKLIEFFERETGMTIQEAYNLSPEGQKYPATCMVAGFLSW